MSEFLYMLAEIDERVRPFIFAVRHWAKIGCLTGDGANMMTNFPLTCLAIAFLQRRSNPILPTLGELKIAARECDIRITDDNIHYTFSRDLTHFESNTVKNNDSLEKLLIEFFQFVSEFNFGMEMISLNNITNLRKLDSSPMIIENPFEIELNVCKAIRFRDLERMKLLASRTADILSKSTKSADKPWGLLQFTNKIH